MADFRRRSRLPWLLFWLTLAVSVVLIVLVFLSPLLDNDEVKPGGWTSILALFARDAAVRRTALASALGLAVTACVFFRPPGSRLGRRTPRPPRPAPPAPFAGA
jgi:hypothetical protein